MDNFGERLRKARKDKKLSQEELANLIGVSRNAITNYEKNSNTPTYENMKKLSNILGVNLANQENSVKAIPIISTASCGSIEINCLQEENMKTFIHEGEWNKDLYAVIACGDSMATEIYDGDIAIIDPTAKVQNGDMVYYKLDDESAIKVFFEDDDNYLINFIPFNTNENFKIRTIRKDDKETNDRLIYHKVVHVVSSKKNNRLARLKIIGR
ncbi:helix-turn-helix domain-containing protein [Aliarcobacter skirrowii]|uniref:XRE family transcriptional regulator n=1 Tax=Aliarcobacter skirrowii TaxID=28200 RepID=A0AAW9DAA4_9BACT|nr:XRE family transcriptional regulator [Aliarcobacter skirrowii]MDX4069149.1 XRE family transcriptional regulator [Aliarcobacter skirrowii]